ncbi:MAG: nitrogen regulation protein NR(II) [Candidimonas sp.]|jgi:two-component system nitrogen regulation sensor histidine kinase GlnL
MDVSSYDLLSTAILLLNPRGRVAHANMAAQELFSMSRKQMAGLSLDAVLGAEAGIQARLPDVMSGKLGTVRQDVVIDRVNASLPLSLTIIPLRGQPWSALIEARLTEQHTLLERHQQLSKELTAQRESLRNLAHEIKNPLGGIRGSAQLLEAELPDRELGDYVRVIIAEADRLAALVDRLIAPQGASLHKQRFNIHEICERVFTLVGAEFPDIAIVRDYDASVPDLMGDMARLVQALLNIARNAAQALTEADATDAPRLVLRTRVARQVLLPIGQVRLGVVVSVIDNGPGVPHILHDKIFHPLVTGRANGSGLGLSLAQEFVQQHGGKMEFDTYPGHTEFRMLLPLELS